MFLEVFFNHQLSVSRTNGRFSLIIISNSIFLMRPVQEEALILFVKKHGFPVQLSNYMKQLRLGSYSAMKIESMRVLLKLCQKINAHKAAKRPKDDTQQDDSQSSWRKGEFKLFVWFLLYYTLVKHTTIQDLTDQDYAFFTTIFLHQTIERLKFEVKCLFPTKLTSKIIWTQKESLFLQQLVQDLLRSQKRLVWKEISYRLYQQSNGQFFKMNCQCREQWFNHLNPELLKREWSVQQDYALMSYVQEYGTKWAEVAKKFDGSRNEHMVKNRYYSLINKLKKNKSNKTNKYREAKIIEEIKNKCIKKDFHLQKNTTDNHMYEESIYKYSSLKESKQLEKLQTDDFSASLTEENVFHQALFFPETTISDSCYLAKERKESFQVDYEPAVGPEAYMNEAYKQTIADIVEKLGCGHPERLDMFFQQDNPHIYEQESF